MSLQRRKISFSPETKASVISTNVSHAVFISMVYKLREMNSGLNSYNEIQMFSTTKTNLHKCGMKTRNKINRSDPEVRIVTSCQQ